MCCSMGSVMSYFLRLSLFYLLCLDTCTSLATSVLFHGVVDLSGYVIICWLYWIFIYVYFWMHFLFPWDPWRVNLYLLNGEQEKQTSVVWARTMISWSYVFRGWMKTTIDCLKEVQQLIWVSYVLLPERLFATGMTRNKEICCGGFFTILTGSMFGLQMKS